MIVKQSLSLRYAEPAPFAQGSLFNFFASRQLHRIRYAAPAQGSLF